MSIIVLVIALSYRIVLATGDILSGVKSGNIYKDYNIESPIRYEEVRVTSYKQ